MSLKWQIVGPLLASKKGKKNTFKKKAVINHNEPKNAKRESAIWTDGGAGVFSYPQIAAHPLFSECMRAYYTIPICLMYSHRARVSRAVGSGSRHFIKNVRQPQNSATAVK